MKAGVTQRKKQAWHNKGTLHPNLSLQGILEPEEKSAHDSRQRESLHGWGRLGESENSR